MDRVNSFYQSTPPSSPDGNPSTTQTFSQSDRVSEQFPLAVSQPAQSATIRKRVSEGEHLPNKCRAQNPEEMQVDSIARTVLSEAQVVTVPTHLPQAKLHVKAFPLQFGTYEGEMVNGKPEGQGKITYEKYCLEGTFEEGKFHNGTWLCLKTGRKLDGTFKSIPDAEGNKLIECEGTMTSQDGEMICKGIFHNFVAMGKYTTFAKEGIKLCEGENNGHTN